MSTLEKLSATGSGANVALANSTLNPDKLDKKDTN
jgi:hypothetical protein